MSKRAIWAAAALLMLTCAALRADSPAPAATPPQAALLDVLRSNASLEQKAFACHQLAWIGNRDAVPVLAGLLEDEKLSHMARYALERIADPSAKEALRAAAPKVKGKLLAGVLSSLGALHDEKSLDELAAHMNDTDADVARAAIFALGKIGTPAAAKSLERAMSSAAAATKPAVFDAALHCGQRLVAEGHVADGLALFDRVAASDAPIQFQVAAIRGEILHGPNSQQLLAKLLEDHERPMFDLALQLAQELPSADTTSTCTAHLDALPAARQALLIQALGVRGDSAALPAIRAGAEKSDPAIRIAAIRSLGLLSDSKSLPLILNAAAASEADVSQAAISTIVKMPGADVDSALEAMAESTDGGKRLAAIQCLGRRHTASATQALFKAAGDGGPQTRQSAIKALSQVASDADLPQALALLQKADSASDRMAAENLVAAICASASEKELCSAKIVAALATAKADNQPTLIQLLATIGGPTALQAVHDSLRKGAGRSRDAAIAALCAWPDQAAAPDLLILARESTQSSNEIRALRGYLRLALDVDLPAEKRLEMSATASPLIQRDEERQLLVRVLGRIQSPKALASLDPFLDLPATKSEAAAAMIAVAGQLAQSADARQNAAAIAAAMEKVKQSNASPDLSKKSGDIAERVRPLLPNP